jgi:hypothetical protein
VEESVAAATLDMKASKKLSDQRVKRTTPTGVYADGDGLYVQVTLGKDGGVRRSWFVRLRLP